MTELPTWLTHDAVSLFTEPWDHTTVRFVWQFSDDGASAVSQYVTDGYPIRLSVTRSTSGTPVTPLDGTRIFYSGVEQDITSGVPILSHNSYFTDYEGPPAEDDHAVTFPVDVSLETRTDATKIRPYADTASLYDRNLSPGTTYYYTMFLLIPTGDQDGELVNGEYRSWVSVASASCKLPGEFDHKTKLYNMLPPYYRYIDQAYLPGTGKAEGDLERLLKIVGQELDYTRALTEGIGSIYDIDRTDERLLRALGEQNFGATYEPALGSIRYRSIMSGLPHIHNTRGTSNGIRRLAQAASQYKTRTVNGTNMLRVTNDAEFVDGTGMWTTDVSTLLTTGIITEEEMSAFSGIRLHYLPDTLIPGFPNGRQTYSVVANLDGNISVIFCGIGAKLTTENDRFHRTHTVNLSVPESAIRLDPTEMYNFSVYIRRVGQPQVDDPGPGEIVVGVLVFAAAPDQPIGELVGMYGTRYTATHSEYALAGIGSNIARSWVDKRHVVGSNDSFIPDRYSVNVNPYTIFSVPNSINQQQSLYAVPYIYFGPTVDEHHVSCAMFTKLPKLVGEEAPSSLTTPLVIS